MNIGIGYFSPCSTEAFRERLKTAEIKRKQEEERMSKYRKPSRLEKARGDARRAIEDRILAKRLGVELEDLQ